LIISTIFSIFWGYLTQEIFIGISNDFTNNGIFILPTHYSKILDSEFLNVYHKNIPIIFSIGSMLFCSYFHENIENFWKNYIIKFKWFLNIIYYNFNLKKWIFDLFINKLFIFYNLKYSFFLWKFIDKGLYEKIGNHGIVFYYRKLIKKINQFHDGFIDNYIFILLSSFLSLIILFFYSITTIIVIFLLLSLIFLTKKI
jgi:NADH-ubiquinone oxidoreductase chain 5